MSLLTELLSQNGARRNDVFNCFPLSSANPTFFINNNKNTFSLWLLIKTVIDLPVVLTIL
jgi:hypothetical protein